MSKIVRMGEELYSNGGVEFRVTEELGRRGTPGNVLKLSSTSDDQVLMLRWSELELGNFKKREVPDSKAEAA